VASINRFADANVPFFAYIAPTVPHGPLQQPPRYKTTPVPTVPDSPAFNEADVSDKPRGFRPLRR